MADDRVREAVDVVARHVIRDVMERADDEWESYPEIGEYDWMEVEERIKEIVHTLAPPTDTYKAAYEFLESRATDEEIA